MTLSEFLIHHTLTPAQIPEETCLKDLLDDMHLGLKGEGNLPMLPSYLSAATPRPQNTRCCVLDAGGTNLRSACADFDEQGRCTIHIITRTSMPGTAGPLSAEQFYNAIAHAARNAATTRQLGFCFSYNVQMNRQLDGELIAWCKEVHVPEAVGMRVGASLQKALGDCCDSVHVLNDSVAAMLGAATPEQPVQVGIILGTGINVCYEESCAAIPKVESDLKGSSMIISTEVGEFDGFPKSEFDLAHFAATEDPALAHAEKQCAGGYLGDLICRVWQAAAREGILDASFRDLQVTLPEISNLLEGSSTALPHSPAAETIARTLIHRAAKIAAILCAGPVIRCTSPGGHVNIAVEGSQYEKLQGFREHFRQELEALLSRRHITFTMVQAENACLKGAALAAFAEAM